MVITVTTVTTIIKKIIDISLVWIMFYIILKNIRNSVKLTLLFKGVIIVIILKVISDFFGFTTGWYFTRIYHHVWTTRFDCDFSTGN